MSDDEERRSIVGSGLQIDPMALSTALESMRKDLEFLKLDSSETRKDLRELISQQKIANGRTTKLEWQLENHRNLDSHEGTSKRLNRLEADSTWRNASRTTIAAVASGILGLGGIVGGLVVAFMRQL